MNDVAENEAPEKKQDEEQQPDKFEEMADEAEMGIVAEFLDFLRYNKKWWLTPIIVVLLAVGVLAMLSGTAAAPFIYTLW